MYDPLIYLDMRFRKPGELLSKAFGFRIRGRIYMDGDIQICIITKVERRGKGLQEAVERLRAVMSDDAECDLGSVPACFQGY